MKLTILGSGTDASNIPGIPNRFPPGYLVQWENEKVLFDCSEGIRFRLEQAGIDYAMLSHLAISHSHPDHYALPQFYQSVNNSLQWRRGPKIEQTLNVYCPEQIAKQFWQLWRLYQASWPDGLPQPKLNFVVLPRSGIIQLGETKLSARAVAHGFGKVEALAFRVERPEGTLAYSGDTGVCEGIKEVAKDADIFICEVSAQVGDRKAATTYGHLGPYDAGTVACEAKVKKIILVHYTGLDSDEAMLEDCRSSGYNGEIVIGKDFMVFGL